MELIQLSSRLALNTTIGISQKAIQNLKLEADGKEYVKQAKEEARSKSVALRERSLLNR
jgi:hypothetical protein